MKLWQNKTSVAYFVLGHLLCCSAASFTQSTIKPWLWRQIRLNTGGRAESNRSTQARLQTTNLLILASVQKFTATACNVSILLAIVTNCEAGYRGKYNEKADSLSSIKLLITWHKCHWMSQHVRENPARLSRASTTASIGACYCAGAASLSIGCFDVTIAIRHVWTVNSSVSAAALLTTVFQFSFLQRFITGRQRSCKPCTSYDRHVRPSVRHTLALSENDAS